MSKKRPPIDPEIELKVRQKCRFACVMCGCPICDYDHIDDWAEVEVHDEKNLTLLCTMHHRLKNKKILSKEVIRDRTDDIMHRPTNGYPDINFPTCKLILGNNIIFGNPSTYFIIKNKDFFRLHYDYLYKQVIINAKFHDKDGNVVFEIKDNIYSATKEAWDVKMKGNSILIREGFRQRLLEIKLDGLKNEIVVYGRIFYEDERYVVLNKDGIFCNNHNLLSKCKIDYCETGLIIDDYQNFPKNKGRGFTDGQMVRCTATLCDIGVAYTPFKLNRLWHMRKKV